MTSFRLNMNRERCANMLKVIARSALAQEEAEEFNGEYSDPINIHLDSDRDGCAC